MTLRLWIGMALAAPVFVLEMGSHLFDLHRLISPQGSNWVQLLLGTPVVFWAGWPFFGFPTWQGVDVTSLRTATEASASRWARGQM